MNSSIKKYEDNGLLERIFNKKIGEGGHEIGGHGDKISIDNAEQLITESIPSIDPKVVRLCLCKCQQTRSGQGLDQWI